MFEVHLTGDIVADAADTAKRFAIFCSHTKFYLNHDVLSKSPIADTPCVCPVLFHFIQPYFFVTSKSNSRTSFLVKFIGMKNNAL